MSTEINMQAFCCREPKFISKPFVQNKQKAATDGRLMVVIPCDEPDTIPEGRAFPKLDTLGKMFEWELRTQPFPVAKKCTDGSEACDKCGGVGYESEVCPSCDGDGECQCACDSVHDCPRCHGSGDVPTGPCCSECEGDGAGYVKVKVGGWNFKGHYIKKINDLLPAPQITMVSKGDAGNSCMKFEFDGGYGFLMGLSKDK